MCSEKISYVNEGRALFLEVSASRYGYVHADMLHDRELAVAGWLVENGYLSELRPEEGGVAYGLHDYVEIIERPLGHCFRLCRSNLRPEYRHLPIAEVALGYFDMSLGELEPYPAIMFEDHPLKLVLKNSEGETGIVGCPVGLK